jgi:hypothetical protein
MTRHAKWIVGLVAVVAVAVLASIPAFLDRSGSGERRAVRYTWLRQVPVSRGAALPDPSTPIGSAPDGQRLLATRIPDGEVCMHFGDSGRQCVTVDTAKSIQLVARVRDPDQNVFWGVLADGVAAISVRRADGSVFRRNVSRAFGVLEVAGEKVVSIAALDDGDRQVGKVSAAAFIPVSCALTSCFTSSVGFSP